MLEAGGFAARHNLVIAAMPPAVPAVQGASIANEPDLVDTDHDGIANLI